MAKKVEAPKIQYPCADYLIKVLGESAHDYQVFVVDILKVHAPDLDLTRMRMSESSNGRFTSITFYITATSEQQLKDLHQDLIQHKRIRMVL